MGARIAYSAALVVASSMLLGCPDNRGTFTPRPDPKLKFTNITLSQSRASAGEEIEITWDFENPDLLKLQTAQGINLTLQGLSPTQPVPLDISDRSFKFQFTGPLTVILMAEDEDTIDDDTLTADSVAFDILLDESSFFELQYRPVDPADQFPSLPSAESFKFPRLGADDFSAHLLRFSQFVGFFDRPSSANGVVDQLEPFLSKDLTFRALSRSVQENEDFDMEQGSGYQALSPSAPGLGASNAYVFGGAIAYDGEDVPIKTEDDPDLTGRHGPILTFEPVFMSIVLLVGFQNQTYDIVDIQLGNLSQGFVATLTTGTLNNGGDLFRGIQGSVLIDSTSNGEGIGTISGSIKGAHVGFGVTTSSNAIFDSIVQIVSADWSMPFLFDTSLNGRLVLTN